MKKIMVIGPRGSGKTSLCNYFEEKKRPLRQSQDTIYGEHTIDVPAAYLENHWMYQYIISIAQNHADILLMMTDNRTREWLYSPNFAQTFTCPVLGVVSHVPEGERIQDMALSEMKQAGVSGPYYGVDLRTGAGLEELGKAVEMQRKRR